MLSSLSENTYKQYDSTIKLWVNYCNKNKYDYLIGSVSVIIDFLTECYKNGAKYGTINSHKSALHFLFPKTLNDDDLKRFMKGIFRLRPPAPRYSVTWDPNVVLEYLSQRWPNDQLNLEMLSKKTVTLLALVTAHRVQTFSLIDVNNIKIQSSNIIITIPDLIKTSRVNSLQPLLKLPFYNEKHEICPARSLLEYLNKTKLLRNRNNNLFISYRKPYNKVTSQTLSSWIKSTLSLSGVDTSVFSAHSTRHSSTSSAKRLGVSLDVIRKTAGWSESSKVFAKFYNKELVDDPNQFANTILSNALTTNLDT